MRAVMTLMAMMRGKGRIWLKTIQIRNKTVGLITIIMKKVVSSSRDALTARLYHSIWHDLNQ